MKKKILGVVLCALLTVSLLPATALAADYVDGFGNVYDENEYEQLKTFLNLDSASEFGYTNGQEMSYMYSDAEPLFWHNVTWTEISGVYHVTAIDWSTGGSYYSLGGALDLSSFTYLTSFKLDYARIDSLNVTNDAALTTLICRNTNMTDWGTHIGVTALDLSTNPNLAVVDVSGNSLTSLDTSAAGANLISLDCSANALTSLNISSHTALTALNCAGNALASLDVSACTALEKLDCYENALTALDVSGNAALECLYCGENALTALDVSHNAALVELECSGNSLTALDVSGNAALEYLYCGENALTALDVSHNTGLVDLGCDSNSLAALDVSGNAALECLYCEENSLTALDLSHNTALYELSCYDNSLTALDLSHNTGLGELDCTGNSISALDVSQSPALEELLCGGNSLTALDLSHNTELLYLECSDNSLTALDLSHNTKLWLLICANNQLATLDAGTCSLSTLDCTGNPLKQIDIHTAGISYLGIPGVDISLTAGDGGYVGLLGDQYYGFLASATPDTGAAFRNWTDDADAGALFSDEAEAELSPDTGYDLTASFLCLMSSDADGVIYTGGRVTFTPNIDGGEWDWDEEYFSATFNSPATFTALKAGTSTITYTAEGISVTYDVTILESALPSTGQSFAWPWLIAAGALLVFAAALTLTSRKRAARG